VLYILFDLFCKSWHFIQLFVFSMATGGSDQTQSGHEDCDWNTRHETIGPPESRSTLRGDKAGAAFIVVDEEISFRCAGHEMDGDNENNVSFVDDGNEAVEHELVTQPAVHGTTVGTRPTVYFADSGSSQLCLSDDVHHIQFRDENVVVTVSTGPPLSQSWRAGDAMMSGDSRIADGRNVTLSHSL